LLALRARRARNGADQPLMPRISPKTHPFKPEDTVSAWQAFAIDLDGVPYTVTTKMRLHGDHPVVKACPSYFTKTDAPTDEVPSMWSAVPDEPEHQREFTPPPAEPIPDDEAAICVMSFTVGFGGPKVVKGQRLRIGDPLVQQNKGFFAHVGKPLA